jgi:hypothetical protein
MGISNAVLSGKKTHYTAGAMPRLNYSHIGNLTDDTGIIHRAVLATPNRKEGYCVDDNARALLWALLAGKDKKNKIEPRLLPVYLSFIHGMQLENGEFKHFMHPGKDGPEDRGSEDSFGRTIMALGFFINEGPTQMLVRTAVGIFSKAYRHIDKLVTLRGISNAIIGVCQYIKYNYPDDAKRDMVIHLSGKLLEAYEANAKGDWKWFEPSLTYDNAILPLALVNAYEVTQDEAYLSVALESMTFLESKVFQKGVVRSIESQNATQKGGGNARRFDQQAIDVMAMILFYRQAFRVTQENTFLNHMFASYKWFLGANDLGTALYDPTTGGCADGYQAGVQSINQGAESTLAYWISHLIVTATLTE